MTKPIGVHDFDFLMGRWRVQHRRLARRLAGCTDWIEFSGTTIAQKILGGLGNMDDNQLSFPEGAFTAVTLRTFDPHQNRWAIYWFDSRRPGVLDPPVVGSFQDGVGAFYADDTFAGKAIRMRFIWSRITPASCSWEQAFSADAGLTWETNWTMEFTRDE